MKTEQKRLFYNALTRSIPVQIKLYRQQLEAAYSVQESFNQHTCPIYRRAKQAEINMLESELDKLLTKKELSACLNS